MRPKIIPVEQLTYLVGGRCLCTDPKCPYKYYEPATFFGVIRIMLGRN